MLNRFQPFFNPYKILTIFSSPRNHHFSSTHSLHSSNSTNQQNYQNPSSKALIGSPARVQKLIASQSDPLLCKEIFDLASVQPNFRHSYSAFHTLILKLGRSRHFSLMNDLILRLKRECYSVTPGLFSDVIQMYGDANLPDKALKTFFTMLEFDCKPLARHLNRLLEVLVEHQRRGSRSGSYLHAAFDLFRTAQDRFGISPNTKSYNILMRAFCFNGELSVAYSLFNQMFKRDVVPDVESYRILMQALCRKSQVSGAVDLLEDMLNKGYVPDALSYNTLLNSLCRKKKLREAYKLLCRMKVKGCNPDIVHYNTVILGFCKEGRAADACKVIKDMPSNGCLPNLVSYRTLVNGLCDQGMLDEAKKYAEEMLSKGFVHFSVCHALVKGFCNVGRVEEASELLQAMVRLGEAPHIETWVVILPRICDEVDTVSLQHKLDRILRVEINKDSRIVDVGSGLEEYLVKKMQAKVWKR
ncbi:hypothetical protein Sjap_007959 [Stephania japonica]|uniref:Pentatricopeptide repeat-containing protein n=1 Tax=Stephania japonica TaxID=461633 RepID=A0AAP0PE53_9MAGN